MGKLHLLQAEDVMQDAGILHAQTRADQFPLLVAAEAESLRDMTDFALEVNIIRPDGQQRWLQV